MTLQEIIDNIDKSNKDSYVNLEEIAREFNIHEYVDGDDSRISSYYYAKWLCTDSWVGGRVYFLDDKPICVSWQSGRKSYEDFEWISQEAFNITHQYILTLISPNIPIPAIADLTQELGVGFHVEYGSQLLHGNVIYKSTGTIVKVTKKFNDMSDVKMWNYIEVQFPDGEIKEVSMSDILAPFDLKKNAYKFYEGL